jgi:hypothetical protein
MRAGRCVAQTMHHAQYASAVVTIVVDTALGHALLVQHASSSTALCQTVALHVMIEALFHTPQTLPS